MNTAVIADAIERQEPFNFEPSALKLQILLIVKTETNPPQEKLEIKHQNIQYKIKYKAELQLQLKRKSHYHMNQGKAYAFLFGQCTTGLQHRIEAKAEYEAKIKGNPDMIYIKTQVFRLLRYYSLAPRNIARSDWVTQNITHNMTSSIVQPHGLLSL